MFSLRAYCFVLIALLLSPRSAFASDLTKLRGVVFYLQQSGSSSRYVGLPNGADLVFGACDGAFTTGSCAWALQGIRLGRQTILALVRLDPYGSNRQKIVSIIDVTGRPVVLNCDSNGRTDSELFAVLTYSEYQRWKNTNIDRLAIRSPLNVYRFSGKSSSIAKVSSTNIICRGPIENTKYVQY